MDDHPQGPRADLRIESLCHFATSCELVRRRSTAKRIGGLFLAAMLGLGAPAAQAGGVGSRSVAANVSRGMSQSTPINVVGTRTSRLARAPHLRAKGDRQAELVVEINLGEGDDAIIAERLTEVVTKELSAASVRVVESGAPSRVTVSVAWDADDNHKIGVRVTNRGEATQAVDGSPFRCEDCNENDLINKIREVVPLSVALLPADDPAADVATPADPDAATPDTATPDNTSTSGPNSDTKPGPLKPLGIVGIAAMGVGAAAAIAGGVMVGVGETVNAVSEDVDDVRDLRPVGFGVLAGGGTALIVGAVLLGIERSRARRGPGGSTAWSQRGAQLSVTPATKPGFTGVTVSGRF